MFGSRGVLMPNTTSKNEWKIYKELKFRSGQLMAKDEEEKISKIFLGPINNVMF